MKMNRRLLLMSKRSEIPGKLAASVLLMGCAYWFMFSRSIVSLRYTQRSVVDRLVVPTTSTAALTPAEIRSLRGKCDLFRGDWVPDPSPPLYTNSCSLIQGTQNCMSNGRPDTGYLYWRWAPRGCELPRLDARRFLELMRNKSWAFVGDSISRNHVQSLLCILSTVEEPIEVYHDSEYRSRRWHIPSYDFNLSVIWSPFLMKAAIFEDEYGVSKSEVELHLDKLDTNWTSLFPTWDYMIISTGAWYAKYAVYFENDIEVGCHRCDKSKRNITDMGFNHAYRSSLRCMFNFIVTSGHKGRVFFRTLSADHFENAEWNHGGTCERTEPSKEGEFELKELDRMLHEIELEEFEKAATKAAEKGVNLELLDVMNLSLTRQDGHPGPYMRFHPVEKGKNATKVQNDCLHWCLPGPIDAWNDVLMQILQM